MASEIIYITESNGYGGAEKYLIEVCLHAKGMYERVSVALHCVESNLKVRSVLESKGINIIKVSYFKGNYPLNLFQAVRFFNDHKDAFFHFSLPYATSCPLMLVGAFLLGCPYVITEHLVPPTPREGGIYELFHYLLFNSLKKSAYRKAQHVIAVSQQVRENLVQGHGMPAGKISVVYNGVTALSPGSECIILKEKLGIPADHLVLTNVARLDDQKGQGYLLTAMQQLITEFPNVTLLLVGDGPKRVDITRSVESASLTRNVRILGYREDVPDILSFTNIFVLPSLNEGFPFSIVEAMSAGLPVIATKVGGNHEAVVDGITGIIVEAGNATQLYAAMKSLIADSEKRSMMGDSARDRALLQFSSAGMLDQTFALYHGVAASCAGR